jgi:hypothetical protein
MYLLEDYLVRAHRDDLLRAACTRHPERCAETSRHRIRRSWRAARAG